MRRLAIYAGSFDPPTNGHVWMIEQGVKLFDYLFVVIGRNASKKCIFTEDIRRDLLDRIICNRRLDNHVSVLITDDDYSVNTAIKLKANYILRGLRDAKDFGEEYLISTVNNGIAAVSFPDKHAPQTIFLPTPPSLAHVSSSMLKGLVGYKNWQTVINQFAPPETCELMKSIQLND